MHQCLKCGRTVSALSDIEEGCPCGSKVFVFSRHGGGLPAPSSADVSSEEGRSPAVPTPASAPQARAAKPKLTLMPELFKPAASAIPAPPAAKPESSGEAIASKPSAPAAVVQEPMSSISDAAPTAPKPSSQSSAAPKLSPVPASSPISDQMAEGEDETEVDSHTDYSEVWLSKGGAVRELNSSEVENVRVLKKGVYELDVRALSDAPLVVRDSEGVYYVRLPFSPLPGPDGEQAPPRSK